MNTRGITTAEFVQETSIEQETPISVAPLPPPPFLVVPRAVDRLVTDTLRWGRVSRPLAVLLEIGTVVLVFYAQILCIRFLTQPTLPDNVTLICIVASMLLLSCIATVLASCLLLRDLSDSLMAWVSPSLYITLHHPLSSPLTKEISL